MRWLSPDERAAESFVDWLSAIVLVGLVSELVTSPSTAEAIGALGGDFAEQLRRAGG